MIFFVFFYAHQRLKPLMWFLFSEDNTTPLRSMWPLKWGNLLKCLKSAPGKNVWNVWISNHPARKMLKIFINHISGWSERWYAPCFPKTAVWPTLQRSRSPANVVFSTHWILAVAGRAVAPFQRLKPRVCSLLHTLKWSLFFVVLPPVLNIRPNWLFLKNP